MQPPDPIQIQRLTPIVEVWSAGAVSPQVPIRHCRYLERAYVAGTDPVLIQLQFDPLIAGQIITVTASSGVILDPPTVTLAVGSTGDCAVTLRLCEGYAHGYVSFNCDGLQTTLPLSLATLAVVASHESANRKGPQ
jgi:hypothetical protein